MSNKKLPEKVKIEYQQYPDGSHICLAYTNGDWLFDLGHENECDPKIANEIAKRWNAYNKKKKTSTFK